MKKILAICLLYFSIQAIQAQTNALEAKAAYLLAEESYGKGDMRSTLQYLNDAISKLGSANAKILYLKIVSLKELSVKDTSFASKLDLAISEFEKSPDISAFNEEKTLEVMKIKLERNKEKKRGAVMQKGFEDLQRELNCYIGMRIDSVIDLHKDMFKDYFKENGEYFTMRDQKSGRKTVTVKERIASEGTKSITDGNNQMKKYVIWKNGTLTSFIYYYYNNPFGKETSDFSLSRNAKVQLLEKFTALFGYLPEPVQTSVSGGASIQYNWKIGGRSVYLIITQHYAASLGYTSYCVVYLN